MTTSSYVTLPKKSPLDLYVLTTDQSVEKGDLPLTEILMRTPEKDERNWARAAKEVRFIRQDTVNDDVFWLKAQDYTYWTLYKPSGHLIKKETLNDQFMDLYREISAFVVIS